MACYVGRVTVRCQKELFMRFAETRVYVETHEMCMNARLEHHGVLTLTRKHALQMHLAKSSLLSQQPDLERWVNQY